MEIDQEVCEYSKQEQTSVLRGENCASEGAWQGEASSSVTGTAVNLPESNKAAHVSFNLGESETHLPLEGPSNTHLRDNNNHENATSELATGDMPPLERPRKAADDAELANVASRESRVGSEPAGTALPHDKQKNQQETMEEPLPPSHHRRGFQEAMTVLSTATHNLEGKLDLLLAQHEEDFFTAFRSHMAEVQKHVHCLRECADAQKNLMMRDLKIKTLQKELKWFLEEAARLDQVRSTFRLTERQIRCRSKDAQLSSLVEASKAIARRRDLEIFFLDCIKEVDKERKLRGDPKGSLGQLHTIKRSTI
ncbi:hypothetical protein Emag_007640 [Eimeria magna]